MDKKMFLLPLAILVIQLIIFPTSSMYALELRDTNEVSPLKKIIMSAPAISYDCERYCDGKFQTLLMQTKNAKVYPIVSGDQVVDYVVVPNYDSIETEYYVPWDAIRHTDRDANKIHDILDEELIGETEEEEKVVKVLLVVEDKDILEKFKSMGGITTHVWSHAVKGFAGKIKTKYIPILAKNPAIAIIEPDFEAKYTLVFSTKTIGATRAWTTLINNMGMPSARDISIAVMDTGVSIDHPMTNGWSDATTNPEVWNDDAYKVVGWYNPVTGSTLPHDDNGHGSHCAGIVIGANVSVAAVDPQGRLIFTDGQGVRYSTSFLGYTGTIYPTFSLYVYVPDVNSEVLIELPRFQDLSKGTGNSANVNSTEIIRPDRTRVAVIYDNGNGDEDPVQNRMLIRFRPIDYNTTQPGIWQFMWYFKYVINTIGDDYYVGSAHRIYVHAYYPTGEYGIISGVAPRTKLVGIKVLNNVGTGTSTNIVSGLDWVVEHRDTYHIVAVSMSFGTAYGSIDATINSAVVNLVRNGIVAVAAAGNYGPNPNTIAGSPGLSDAAITVAAAYSCTYRNPEVTLYSSRGPGSGSKVGNTTKPDITAIGGFYDDGTIISIDTTYNDEILIHTRTTSGWDISKSSFGWSETYPHDFAILCGTSAATPQVSGAVAMIISALYGGWKNWPRTAIAAAQVKAILCATAWEIGTKNRADKGGKDSEEGFGLLQIDAAIDAVTKSYTIGTSVMDSLYSDPFSKHVWARKVYLVSGHTYTFELKVPETADFDLYLWAWDPKPATTSPYGTWGEPQILAWSDRITEGADEAITYTSSKTGWYILTVKQISGGGTFQLESSEEINPPTCIIVSPASGSTVSGTITVQVFSVDISPGMVVNVTLYIDEGSPRDMIYNATTGYWETSVDTTTLSEGRHSLRAKAIDDEGNCESDVVEIFVDNIPSAGNVPTIPLQQLAIIIAISVSIIVILAVLPKRKKRHPETAKIVEKEIK